MANGDCAVWNHRKKSLWPTKPNPICKIVPFHLISWNYFVCDVVRTTTDRCDGRDRQTVPVANAIHTHTHERTGRWDFDCIHIPHTYLAACQRADERLEQTSARMHSLDRRVYRVYWERAYCVLLCGHEWTDSHKMKWTSNREGERCVLHHQNIDGFILKSEYLGSISCAALCAMCGFRCPISNPFI